MRLDMPLIHRRRGAIALALGSLLVDSLLLALPACSGTTDPTRASNDVLFAVGNGSAVAVVDLTTHSVLRPGPSTERDAPTALAPDSSSVYFVAHDGLGGGVYSMNRWGVIERRVSLFGPPTDLPLGGISMQPTAMAVGPRERHLYVGPVYTSEERQRSPPRAGSIAVVDLRTGHVTDTIGPFLYLNHMRVVPPGPAAPHGEVLVTGRRPMYAVNVLFVIDPATRSVVDSVLITYPGTGVPVGIGSIALAPDARRAYLVGAGLARLYGYDLGTRQVYSVAAGRGGDFLYLASGKFDEPAKILVMNRATGRITSVIPVGTTGPVKLYSAH